MINITVDTEGREIQLQLCKDVKKHLQQTAPQMRNSQRMKPLKLCTNFFFLLQIDKTKQSLGNCSQILRRKDLHRYFAGTWCQYVALVVLEPAM